MLNFLKRSGSYVFLATIFAKILSLAASWVALQFIDNQDLGVLLFSYNVILFILPISGLGLHQSLLRFSALNNNTEDKNHIFLYVLKYGLISCLVLISIIIITSFFISYQFEKAQFFIIILSFLLIPAFLFEIIKTQLRLNHDNKSYAYSEFLYSLIFLILITVLTFYYQENGYVISLLLAPVLASLFFIKKIKIKATKIKIVSELNFQFWRYGFFASLSNVVTQLLFAIDILLIGYLINDAEMVTNYRYVSIIPFSLLFLPRVFINTDFVAFTEKILDKNYIRTYIKSYIQLFTILSFLLIMFSYFFGSFLLSLLDESFIKYQTTFFILMLGISGIFILRGLFGNLLSSIGKAHINYYIASIALVINIISNYYLIPKYGIKGAAITSAILMWLTGLFSFICFKKLYKRVLLNAK
ncbi:polysaccharide biosynthesis C-terminal domain-containing protein [Polaribacter sp. KT 15]|uniref:oligosaccharide flippase family protein n=1 Tax=Polaribacter sp. KT 15 TaxID=1896175 RepID=UPI002676ABFC|nr:polysaccharide biosynthesis C-terminal domain-containing protein [Polaribacter sp. KT 15]